MTRTILAWLDNPIIVKHSRSSLRVQPLAASAVVVTIVLPAALAAAAISSSVVDKRFTGGPLSTATLSRR